MLEHRQEQQVLEPQVPEIARTLDLLERRGPERLRPIMDLAVPPEVLRLRSLPLQGLVVLLVDGDDGVRPVVPVEHQRRIERPEAVQPFRVEATRRVGESDLRDLARRVTPPGADGPIGQRKVGGEITEEVEGEGFRRQEVRPEAVMVEALLPLDERGPCPRRGEGRRRHEVRAGLLPVGERDPASDWSWVGTGARAMRLVADRDPVGLAPAGLMEASSLAERRHGGSPRRDVARFPAVGGLERLPARPSRLVRRHTSEDRFRNGFVRSWQAAAGPCRGSRPTVVLVDDHLSTREVGWIVGHSAGTLLDRLKAGEIEATRTVNGYRIPKEEALRLGRERIEAETGRKIADRKLERVIDDMIEANENARPGSS